MNDNFIKLEIEAKSENVSLARVVAAGFLTPWDATVGEVTDIKTAISEAVTNAIIHGYAGAADSSIVTMELSVKENILSIKISDKGVGIEDIESAKEPLFTTKPEMERSGLGFTVMESFMDDVKIESNPGAGTTVTMTRKLGAFK
ncbi:MAG: anti-sigma F factor [Defluviitaleaceae bacterium]|nr:anti-sigma F factor [Defluviitaleaceae bacterium]